MAFRNAGNEAKWSLEALRSILHYDPITGKFTRLSKARTSKDGAAGFVMTSGYRVVRAGNTKFLAHRLAWFMTHGEWPQQEIDHQNRNRDDNRISNLRVVSRKENSWNSGPHSDRKFSIKNVYPARRGMVVNMYRNGEILFRKRFRCLGQAVKARNAVLATFVGSN